MADTKREIRALGQRISGLQAGEQYTFVLKKPKPKADLENARRAVRSAGSYLSIVRHAADELDRAVSLANQGGGGGGPRQLHPRAGPAAARRDADRRRARARGQRPR